MALARSAAFFDLDKTVIARSSTLAFSRSFFAGGLLTRRSVLRSAYAQFMFAVGGADHDQLERMRMYIASMVNGWDAQTVRQIVAETLHDIIDPLVYAEAVELIAQHHAAGREVVIVSASGLEVVEPIGAMLGADRVLATRLVVEDGKFTDRFEVYAYGPHKAELIEQLAQECGYDLDECYAYSDSETDLPMLECVGHPFAVNPDKGLRKAAKAHGWPVLRFSRPVALRRSIGLHSRGGKVVAATAFSVTLAVAGIAATSFIRRHIDGRR
jgi:HAD superfamily hydrolase (TIGR01490 family)